MSCHARLTNPQPGVDAGQGTAGPRGGKCGSGAVGLSRGVERHSGTHGEERHTRGWCPCRRHPEVHGGLREPTDPELRLPQQRQRLAIEVIGQPRLANEESPRVLEPPRLHLCLGALHYEERIGIRIAPRGGEQRFGGMPGTAGQAEGVGAIRGGVVRLDRASLCAEPAGHRQQQCGGERRHPKAHCLDCLTRISTCWYSDRDEGVNRKRLNPV